jgi:hypothetical protein
MPRDPLTDETFSRELKWAGGEGGIAEALTDVAKQLDRLATVAENAEKFYQPGPYFKVGTTDTGR